MTSANIFLILISGLGVLNGLFLAVYLWINTKGNTTSNKILALLLLVLSFRVGKSVFLEFAADLAVQIVFIGLAFLMAVGPLFLLYVRSLLNASFKFRAKYLAHFIPALGGLAFGFWIDEGLAHSIPTAVFVVLFVVYYGHYLIYLLVSYRYAFNENKEELPTGARSLLRLLFFALLAVWAVYVLNLFDNIVPYVVGPVLYTLVAYSVSFVAIKRGYIRDAHLTKYKTTFVSDEQIDQLFAKVQAMFIVEKRFKDGELSLKSLSEQLNVTPQTLSMVINKRHKGNFNSFVNYHRVAEAIAMFQNKAYKNHTIASIAYEVGFNSISSFNTAFKTQTGSTPMAFRKKAAEMIS